jgi:hypothetical protein
MEGYGIARDYSIRATQMPLHTCTVAPVRHLLDLYTLLPPLSGARGTGGGGPEKRDDILGMIAFPLPVPSLKHIGFHSGYHPAFLYSIR